MSNSPLVSIVIPSYNQGKYLRQTLNSVFSQDYRPLEVLVLDGASKDETLDVLTSFDGTPGFWWKSEPDKGVVDAVNQGLARATGELCGILSSDDYYLPGAIQDAVSAFVKDSQLGLVYADAEYVDSEDRIIGRTSVANYSLPAFLSRQTFIIQCSAFFRTQLARDVGSWRPEVSYVADNDLWLRMALAGPFQRVPGIWSRYRFHEAQRDTQRQRIVREWEQSVRDIRSQLSPPLRLAARVGCHLTAHRYTSSTDWLGKTYHLYAALINDPRIIFWRDFPRKDLLQPLWQVLSGCKRLLLGKPLFTRRPERLAQ